VSQHRLTPKTGYEHYDIAVGWDRPLGSYFAYVAAHAGHVPRSRHLARIADALNRLPIPMPRRIRALDPEPVMILADDIDPISDPAQIIAAVAPYAELPDDLEAQLAADRFIEGYRHHPRH
jgi:hypothetical protein